MTTKTPSPDLNSPPELIESAIADIFERLGFRRLLGRIWALLYLSPTPIEAEEIKKKLKISTGSLSSGINELLKTGLIHRRTQIGNRRFYYEAETEMWSVFTKLFKERERVLITEALKKLKTAERLLSKQYNSDHLEQTEHRLEQTEHRLNRIRHLIGLGEFVLALLDRFVERTRTELKTAQKWLSVSGRISSEPLSRIRKRISAIRNDLSSKKE